MAVDTMNLTNPVLQAIETWMPEKHHSLGYETVDRTTGRKYRYSEYTAGAATVRSGMPGGAYVVGTDALYTANNVTDDASLALGLPTCVFRGSATNASCYGFVEVIDMSLPTTVLTSYDNSIGQDDELTWDIDGCLDTSEPSAGKGTTEALVRSFIAVAMDSHLASKDQAGSTIATITPITVRWL